MRGLPPGFAAVNADAKIRAIRLSVHIYTTPCSAFLRTESTRKPLFFSFSGMRDAQKPQFLPVHSPAGKGSFIHSIPPCRFPWRVTKKTKTSRKNAQFSHGTSSFLAINYNIKAAAVNSAFEKIRSGGTIVFLQIDD